MAGSARDAQHSITIDNSDMPTNFLPFWNSLIISKRPWFAPNVT